MFLAISSVPKSLSLQNYTIRKHEIRSVVGCPLWNDIRDALGLITVLDASSVQVVSDALL